METDHVAGVCSYYKTYLTGKHVPSFPLLLEWGGSCCAGHSAITGLGLSRLDQLVLSQKTRFIELVCHL